MAYSSLGDFDRNDNVQEILADPAEHIDCEKYFKLINFPVFNVADCYVTVSVALLIILILFVYKEDDFGFLKLSKKGDNNE